MYSSHLSSICMIHFPVCKRSHRLSFLLTTLSCITSFIFIFSSATCMPMISSIYKSYLQISTSHLFLLECVPPTPKNKLIIYASLPFLPPPSLPLTKQTNKKVNFSIFSILVNFQIILMAKGCLEKY